MKKIYMIIFSSLLLMSFVIPGLSDVQGKTNEIQFTNVDVKTNQAERQIPMLASLQQVSPNQLTITYDRPVDLNKATKASNYWIQSLTDVRPKGIATLGKNDKVTDQNALTSDKVMIRKIQGNNNSFLLTFKQNITRNKKYKLIICYVTVPGGAPYSGDNGMKVFTGK